VAKNTADEAIIAAQQELEVYRREASGKIAEAVAKTDQAIAQAGNEAESAVQARTAELQKLKNQTAVTLEASAHEEEARILAKGEGEAVQIVQSARNEILAAKAELMSKYGDSASTVLFLKEKLPELFAKYSAAVNEEPVDSYVVMDDEEGFSGAVNRGPRAFADFLGIFSQALGIEVKDLIK
jgi:hypothetical protein